MLQKCLMIIMTAVEIKRVYLCRAMEAAVNKTLLITL